MEKTAEQDGVNIRALARASPHFSLAGDRLSVFTPAPAGLGPFCVSPAGKPVVDDIDPWWAG
jgi:hypothetical protein